MLKALLDRWSGSQNPLTRSLARAVRAVGYARRFVLNPRIRSEQLTRLRQGREHLQGATHTEPNRYPELFAACARELARTPAPRILSFGCSTGEEAASLAALLPHAVLVGVDINPWCLRQAAKAHPQFRFLQPSSAAFAAEPPFDAIFAMAVFQRTENRTTDTAVALGSFTFARFEEEVARLDSRLRPGGLLFLDECDFLFADTVLASRYQPLAFAGNRALKRRPLFNAQNRRVATEYVAARAYRKLA